MARRPVRFFALAVLVSLLNLGPVSAQSTSGAGTSLSETGTNPLDGLRRRMADGGFSSALAPLEGAVDPDVYRVGPGDLFTVSIGSLALSATPIPVSADGFLALPDAGLVKVSGLSLTEARARSTQALQRAYSNLEVSVTLSQPRQFYVHVSGAVPVPGRYLTLPVGRVSSVLALAFADTVRAPVGNASYRPSLRNVRLVRRTGEEIQIDLLQYFSSGILDQNPFLVDGDVVFVPGYDPAYQSVFVDGALPFPGDYDVRPADTVADVLLAAGMTSAPPQVSTVRISSTDATGAPTVREIPVRDALGSVGRETVVRARDHISVSPDQPALGSASVSGWVFHEGTYGIRDGETTVIGLLDQAGGMRDGALPAAAYLERRLLPDSDIDIETGNRAGPIEVPDLSSVLSADTLSIMQRLRLSDLDFLSRAYFAQELRTQNRVSINLEAMLAGDESPVVIRDGDRLIVPRDDGTVLVFGQVVRPGFVAVGADRTPEGYVSAAGGRGFYAARTYLVRGATGEVITDLNTPVMSGDMVFVDRKDDIAENPELQRLIIQQESAKASARLGLASTIVGSVGTLATIVTLIVSLSR